MRTGTPRATPDNHGRTFFRSNQEARDESRESREELRDSLSKIQDLLQGFVGSSSNNTPRQGRRKPERIALEVEKQKDTKAVREDFCVRIVNHCFR